MSDVHRTESYNHPNNGQKTIQQIHGVTALITIVTIVFFLFFQLNKSGPFRDVNPFGEDPYDAVGSFAIQGALLIGMLTYARAVRFIESPSQALKLRLILRGNVLVLGAILVTLLTDAIAEVSSPFQPSYWGNVMLLEQVFMFLLGLISTFALVVVFKEIQTGTQQGDLTPADGIDDLWTLVRVPVTKASALLPPAFVEWVERFNSDRLFARVPWLNPRSHPWRFACLLGLSVGIGLLLAQFQEGLPPSLMTGLLVAGIFLSAELCATLLGFTILGGYLGLRPTIHKRIVNL